VLQHLVEEVAGGEPLALQAALHVADGQQHGVDGAGLDLVPQLLDGQHPGDRHRALPCQQLRASVQVTRLSAVSPALAMVIECMFE
jgi:hypothetical protein